MPEPNNLLRTARERTLSRRTPGACMSRDEVADLVVQWLTARDPRHRDVAFDGNHLGKLERGIVTRPRTHYVAALCAVLGASEAELGFGPGDSAPVSPLPVVSSPADLLASTIDGDAQLMSPPAMVSAIRAMSHAFQTADRQVGGGVLYGTVIRYLNTEIGPRLLDASGAVGSALFAAGSSMTEIAGWMAHDAGHDETARRHFDRAFRLASAAPDNALAANVCASMSHLAGQLRQPTDAVRIAEAGLTRARATAGTVRLVARLHAMRARGLAMRGEHRACATSLADAERALSETGDEQPAEWIARFDDGSLASEAALCLRQLGDLTGAERQALRVIELRCGDRVRSRTFGQLTLADVLLDAGRIDEAAHVGQAVCDVAPSLTSARVRGRLDDLGARLKAHRTVPEVADFLTCLATVHHTDSGEGTAWPV